MSFPEKKDMFYFMLILVGVIVVISVWRVDDPSKLNDQLSLASTLTSIALAVVAIIFAVVHQGESNRQANEMSDKMNELKAELLKSEFRNLKKNDEIGKLVDDLKEPEKKGMDMGKLKDKLEEINNEKHDNYYETVPINEIVNKYYKDMSNKQKYKMYEVLKNAIKENKNNNKKNNT